MAWILETVIGEIHTAYAALPGGRAPLLGTTESGGPLLGNLEKAHHAELGRVVWTLQTGTFDPAKVSGGVEGTMYEALANFQIWIWQADLETCWNVMCDLLAAMRQTIYGPNLGAQTFASPTEVAGREMHHGELMLLNVSLSVPIRTVGTVPDEEVTLEAHESTVTADNGEADEDGEFEAFETVLVTGPPT